MKNLLSFDEFLNESVNKKIKVGDLVGNTVQGFDFKVISISGDRLKVKNTVTGETKDTYVDNMYLPESVNESIQDIVEEVSAVFAKIKAHSELKQVMRDPGDATVTEIENFISNPAKFKLDYLNSVSQIMRSRTGYTEGPQSTPVSRLKGAILHLADAIKFADDKGKFGFEYHIEKAESALEKI